MEKGGSVGAREPSFTAMWHAWLRYTQEAANAFILMTVTRCRVFADRLRPAHERGVRRLVILGAGLDVTGFGLPAWAEQSNLIFAPCDFERQGLMAALADAGFDARIPAMVSLFGVLLYLSPDATKQTLAELATLAPGSELTCSYCSPSDQTDSVVRELMSKSTSVVDATGESFVGYYRTAEMESLVRAAGFTGVLHHRRGTERALLRREA